MPDEAISRLDGIQYLAGRLLRFVLERYMFWKKRSQRHEAGDVFVYKENQYCFSEITSI
jgi:hypothetical protein